MKTRMQSLTKNLLQRWDHNLLLLILLILLSLLKSLFQSLVILFFKKVKTKNSLKSRELLNFQLHRSVTRMMPKFMKRSAKLLKKLSN